MMDQNERSAAIQIGGETYELLLTTKATKEIAKRYGGLENLGTKLMKSENFEMALDEIIWLIALMANQSILIYNLRHKDEPKPLLTEEEVELLTSPLELATYKDAIMEAMFRGTKRNIESEADPKNGRSGKRRGVVYPTDLYATVPLRRTEEEAWLMPFGYLLDLWECHKQFTGISKPKRELFIDDIIPAGI